jgi:hypothetical protein
MAAADRIAQVEAQRRLLHQPRRTRSSRTQVRAPLVRTASRASRQSGSGHARRRPSARSGRTPVAVGGLHAHGGSHRRRPVFSSRWSMTCSGRSACGQHVRRCGRCWRCRRHRSHRPAWSGRPVPSSMPTEQVGAVVGDHHHGHRLVARSGAAGCIGGRSGRSAGQEPAVPGEVALQPGCIIACQTQPKPARVRAGEACRTTRSSPERQRRQQRPR